MDSNLSERVIAIFKEQKINFSDLHVIITDVIEDSIFQKPKDNISPKDFLRFAKKDFSTNDERGFINAITNAKRAIDCQTDKILFAFNINIEKFPQVAIEFIQRTIGTTKSDLKVALKLIEALGIAPIGLISEARTLRHKLEHYYITPTAKETKAAIETAELFINATENKLSHLWSYYFGNYFKQEEMFNHINVQYLENDKYFKLVCADGETLDIPSTSSIFYYLLKITISISAEDINDVQDSFRNFLQYLNHPMPTHNIKIKLY